MSKPEHFSFEQPPEQKDRSIIAGIGVGVLTVASAAVAYKTGVAEDLLAQQVIPQPTAEPSIVEGFVVANESLRTVAPVATYGAVAVSACYYARGRFSPKVKTLNEMSKIEYSGTDDSSETQDSSRLMARIKNKSNAFKRGTSVAALSVLLTGVTSGLEHEISNGPQRPIDAMYQVLGPNSTERSLLLQAENNTFMDDSDIKREPMNNAVMQAKSQGVTMVPFDKKLFNIDGRSALQVSIPDELFKQKTGIEVGPGCDTVPAIVDSTVEKKPGETMDINGVNAQVVGVQDDIAQMNRSIAILSDSDMQSCLQDKTDDSYFGAIVPNKTKEELAQIVSQNPELKAAAVSEQHFAESNRKFWRANGTPILLQLIAYVGLFGGFAAVGERVSAMQRNRREIGIMNAQGVSIKDIQAIEDRRALRDTAKATLIAAPAMPVMAAVFNMAELGLRMGTGLRELCVGATVTGIAKLIGGRRAVNKFAKNQDLSQAVKG